MAKLLKPIQFIYSDEKIKGKGIEGDPMRRIEQYFTTEGDLVLEYDHHFNSIACAMNMRDLLKRLSEHLNK